VIARDLTEGIRLMIAHPYWRDLLKFSAGGKLAEMRTVLPYLERELRDDEPDIERHRSFLRKRLRLAESDDPIAALHYAASVLSGFDRLFNTFSLEDNRAWE